MVTLFTVEFNLENGKAGGMFRQRIRTLEAKFSLSFWFYWSWDSIRVEYIYF